MGADEEDDDLDLGDLEDGDDDEVAATDEPGDTCLPKRRRRGRRKLPEALPRVEIEIVPEEVQREGLDAFKRIGEVVSESVERGPASLVVLRLIRPKFVHKETPEPDPRAEDDGEPEAPVVLIAEPPEKPIERGLAGPGLLAATIGVASSSSRPRSGRKRSSRRRLSRGSPPTSAIRLRRAPIGRWNERSRPDLQRDPPALVLGDPEPNEPNRYPGGCES